jgi:hypothetical protein
VINPEYCAGSLSAYLIQGNLQATSGRNAQPAILCLLCFRWWWFKLLIELGEHHVLMGTGNVTASARLLECRLGSSCARQRMTTEELMNAIKAMCGEPSRAWTLEGLAGVAGMFRARFAAQFRETVGLAPGAYLSE